MRQICAYKHPLQKNGNFLESNPLAFILAFAFSSIYWLLIGERSGRSLRQIQGVVTCICHLLKCLRLGSRVLISQKCAWSLDHFLLRLLIAWFSKGQRSNCSRTFYFTSSKPTLIPWSAPQMGFDCLIQFRSWSQMLLHGTYKWLPLEIIATYANLICLNDR